MSVHIKRIPQVLSGDNFPATDPEDGTYFVFNVAQTSFISGKTIRNDDDTADVTSASERDLFKYFTAGTKWVRQYRAVNIPADSVGLAELAHGTSDALLSYNSSGAPVERYGLIPFTGHLVGTYQTVAGAPGSGQIQIVAAGTSVVLSRTDNAGTDQNSVMGDDFNNRNYALVLVASSIEYIFRITSKAYDLTNQRWTLAGTWISNDGTSIAASTDCQVRIIKHNTDLSPYTNTTPTLLWESASGYSTTGTDEDLDTGNFTDYDWIYFYARDQWNRGIGGFLPRTQFAIANATFRLSTHGGHILPKYIDANTFQLHALTTGFDLLAIYGL